MCWISIIVSCVLDEAPTSPRAVASSSRLPALLSLGRVGKTSILLRYVRGEYNDKQQSTIQASYLDKRVTVGPNTAQLSIWDTAGQERFHALGPIYYRDAGMEGGSSWAAYHEVQQKDWCCRLTNRLNAVWWLHHVM